MLYVLLSSQIIKSIDNLFIEISILKRIAIPPNIAFIGCFSFSKCTSLKEIAIPYSVTSIENNAFNSCDALKNVFIPSSVISIGDYAFYKCKSIINISIPSVVSIGSYAFFECSSLSRIIITSSLRSIGNGAFSRCEALDYFWLPDSIESIGYNAFEYCNKLIELTIPPSITIIKEYSFRGCKSLTKITIPSSVESIEEHSFDGCLSLNEINIPQSVRTIESHCFYNCRSLKNITIPSSVTSIKEYAFGYCDSLAQIKIPSSVESINNRAFYKCNPLNKFCTDDLTEDAFGCYIPYDIFSIYSLPIFVCLLAEFIVSIIWWSRIHPWFAHGYKTGKIVYQCLEICWISSLLLIFFMILGLILYLFLNYKTIIANKKIIDFIRILRSSYSWFLLIAFICLSLISIISGIIASTYTWKKGKIDGKSIKCLKYIVQGSEGAYDWVVNKSLKEQKKFENWYSKMLKKAYKKNGGITNYYCLEVGIPTFIFAFLPLFMLFLYSCYLLIVCICIKCC